MSIIIKYGTTATDIVEQVVAAAHEAREAGNFAEMQAVLESGREVLRKYFPDDPMTAKVEGVSHEQLRAAFLSGQPMTTSTHRGFSCFVEALK
jgi:hypothetical protein